MPRSNLHEETIDYLPGMNMNIPVYRVEQTRYHLLQTTSVSNYLELFYGLQFLREIGMVVSCIRHVLELRQNQFIF